MNNFRLRKQRADTKSLQLLILSMNSNMNQKIREERMIRKTLYNWIDMDRSRA
jgi:hypothetical protein